VIAATAARWTALKIPESMFVLTWASAPTATGLPTAHPTRQPVMLCVLEIEPISRATSSAPGTCRMLGAT
jgi:hypothetical protein